MRDLVLDPREAPRAGALAAPSPFDERPNPVFVVLRSVAEAIVTVAAAIGKRCVAMPFATLVVVASFWGACAILGNLASQHRPHPAPMFARAPDPALVAAMPARPTPAPVQAPVAVPPPAPRVAAPAEPALAVPPLPPQRDIAAIIAVSAPRPAAVPASPANDLVRDLQRVLAQRGLYSGVIDGVMGARTERAIRAAEQGLGRLRPRRLGAAERRLRSDGWLPGRSAARRPGRRSGWRWVRSDRPAARAAHRRRAPPRDAMTTPRLTSAFWVAAYVRRVNTIGDGAFAAVMKKGSDEAGPILIRVDRPDRLGRLFVPAPQSAYDERPRDRLFVARTGFVDAEALATAIARETRFDPDLWLVGVEDRDGRDFLDASLVDG